MASKSRRLAKCEISDLLSFLRIDYAPDHLIGRDEQIKRLTHDIRASMKATTLEGHILYLYGQPGTGKSASVKHVVERLREDPKLPKFAFSHINALGLGSLGGLFQQLHKSFFPKATKKPSIHEAFSKLDDGFRNKGFKSHHIVAIDEFDNLLTIGRSKSQPKNSFHQRLFSLFEWPAQPRANFTLICIANTLCLPQHLLPRCFSRLGLGQINFPTYAYEELQQILQERFRSFSPTAANFFEPMSMELLCRKVAAFSGDVRKLLDFCASLLQDLQSAPSQKTQITCHDVERKCRIQFVSRASDYIRRSAFTIQLAALCICALQPAHENPTTGFAVGVLELRSTFENQFKMLSQRQLFAPPMLDELLAQALDDLHFAGIIDFVQYIRLEFGSRTLGKATQRTDLLAFAPWGQLGVHLVPPINEIVDGAKVSSAAAIQQYASLIKDHA